MSFPRSLADGLLREGLPTLETLRMRLLQVWILIVDSVIERCNVNFDLLRVTAITSDVIGSCASLAQAYLAFMLAARRIVSVVLQRGDLVKALLLAEHHDIVLQRLLRRPLDENVLLFRLLVRRGLRVHGSACTRLSCHRASCLLKVVVELPSRCQARRLV